MKIAYVEQKRWHEQTKAKILMANQIIEEYQEQGYSLTLRQLYYQFVARGYIENTAHSYNRLGNAINTGRLTGWIDWDAIKDPTREPQLLPKWDSPQDIMELIAESYHIDLWETQDEYVEVWIEKQALLGVIEDTCNKYDVLHFACKGYSSQTAMHDAALRLRAVQCAGSKHRPCTVIYLGDHDPSGLDMVRDVSDRLSTFQARVHVQQIALTREQIDEYTPPPNYAKMTDSRAADYVAAHGDKSWELDALEPSVINDLVEAEILKRLDMDAFEDRKKEREYDRTKLQYLAESFDSLTEDFDKQEDSE